MPTNKHHTLGLVPLKRSECKWALHTAEEYIQFTSPDGEDLQIPISLHHNNLNYIKIEVLLPRKLLPSSNEVCNMITTKTNTV